MKAIITVTAMTTTIITTESLKKASPRRRPGSRCSASSRSYWIGVSLRLLTSGFRRNDANSSLSDFCKGLDGFYFSKERRAETLTCSGASSVATTLISQNSSGAASIWLRVGSLSQWESSTRL